MQKIKVQKIKVQKIKMQKIALRAYPPLSALKHSLHKLVFIVINLLKILLNEVIPHKKAIVRL